jgi:hypothetical protein
MSQLSAQSPATAIFGHSADVVLQLRVGDRVLQLSHVSHDFVRLAAPADVDADMALVEVIVDGVQTDRRVRIASVDASRQRLSVVAI